MLTVRNALWGCALLVIASAVAAWAVQTVESGSQPPTLRPVPQDAATRPLDVSLDPSGRPYDAVLLAGARVERRPLTVLHAPSRRVLFMGGEYVMYARSGEFDDVLLADTPGREYPVHAIWLERKGTRFDTIVGVVLVERDGEIARWEQLERAGYVTDGGVGGITTPEWAARHKAEENEVSKLYWSELVDKGRMWFAVDADGHAGIDSIVFGNGYGDGAFPAIAGYDAAGRRAAIVLWSIAAPWRLAFPQGIPPLQVTRRERELAACLAGKRRVDGYRCRVRQ